LLIGGPCTKTRSVELVPDVDDRGEDLPSSGLARWCGLMLRAVLSNVMSLLRLRRSGTPEIEPLM
jgi:hypothetical protein